MNRIITLGIILTLLGVLIAPVFFQHSDSLSAQEIDCGLDLVPFIFDQPLQRLAIMNVVVTGKDGDVVHVSAYTIAGLIFARFNVNCKDGSSWWVESDLSKFLLELANSM